VQATRSAEHIDEAERRLRLTHEEKKVAHVTDVGAQTRGTGRKGRKGDQRGNAISRLFGSLGLFISQILDELRKVVRPTGPELVRYTTVVVVFVVIMMALVSGLDFVLSRLISWAFTGSPT
jgi:preprotein translocase subunit SecE